MPVLLLHFHHIRSPRKIRILHSLVASHSLLSIFRRGHPGILFASSPSSSDLKSFTKEVKKMRWQSCTVAGLEEGLGVEGGNGWERGVLKEVEKVRDVVWGVGGDGGDWCRKRLGLGKEE